MSGAEREASSVVFDRWMGKADENIAEWGIQDEETLLLAMQEELGELTQAHLEATHENGDELRVDVELDDLGALLIQLHEVRNNHQIRTESDWCSNCGQDRSKHPVKENDEGIACQKFVAPGTDR